MTKRTNKILLGLALGILISLIIILFIISIYTGRKNNSTRITPDNSSLVETVYIVKDYNEKLAVYFAGENEPMEVYDLFLSSLPETDAERIRDGIIVYDKAELNQLIEDFTS